MIQSHYSPPNIRKIRKAFPDMDPKQTLFAHNNIMYNPGKMRVSPDMFAHEEVHCKQQLEFEGGANAWWDKYIEDAKFRLEQEIPAYRKQYEVICDMIKVERVRMILLGRLATQLASKMYGSLLKKNEAMELIH